MGILPRTRHLCPANSPWGTALAPAGHQLCTCSGKQLLLLKHLALLDLFAHYLHKCDFDYRIFLSNYSGISNPAKQKIVQKARWPGGCPEGSLLAARERSKTSPGGQLDTALSSLGHSKGQLDTALPCPQGHRSCRLCLNSVCGLCCSPQLGRDSPRAAGSGVQPLSLPVAGHIKRLLSSCLEQQERSNSSPPSQGTG